MPSRIKLRPRSTPPTPGPDSETLFLDETDGVLKSIDSEGVVTAVEGGGGAAEAGTVVSDTDPGAIGAGNIWVREYDDTAFTGRILYQVNIRNDADDGWLQPELLDILGGVLRSRMTLDYGGGGGDVEIRDASGNTVLLVAFGPTGELDISSNAFDGAWVNRLKLTSTFAQLERQDAGGAAGIYVDADGMLVGGFGAKLGFNGTAAILPPVIPASPTAAQIADVLVALGLATQGV